MILASMLIAVGFFIHAASLAASRSCADAVFDLAGRSLLSEYDLQLQERYDLYAFHTDEREAESKIKYYADYSFHDNMIKEVLRTRNYKDLMKLKLDSVSVDLKGYSLTDVNQFKQQILDSMQTGIVKDLIFTEEDTPAGEGNSVLRNEQIINSLPSNGYQSSVAADMKSIVESGLPSMKDIYNVSKDDYLVNEYILSHFYDHRRGNPNDDSFFTNEVEYILHGDFSDDDNYHYIRAELFVMRNTLNFAHINSDPQKLKKAEAIAALLTLGKGYKVGAPVVIEAWAAAETENDLMLLEAGKKVALIKGKSNWAVPISNTLEYLWKDNYVKPNDMSGYDYQDYLRILLYLEDNEKKLLRCMDLIQINLVGSYNRDFNLKEYYGGFHFEADSKGKTFTYDQKY
jgi:hypothetical protein